VLCVVVHPGQGDFGGRVLIVLTLEFDFLYFLGKRGRGEGKEYKARGEPLSWASKTDHFGSPLEYQCNDPSAHPRGLSGEGLVSVFGISKGSFQK
jgi:hypothetical protein